jgi:hypothetical protein
MPSRKQRRRREKSFRHEYEYVLIDDDGNEVVVPPDEKRDGDGGTDAAPTGGRAKKTQPSKTKSREPARVGREVKPPSWRRVGRRALLFAPLMFVVVSVLDNGLTPAQHAVQTAFLLVFFLPFSYVMDTVAYRMFLKRTGRTAEPAPASARRGLRAGRNRELKAADAAAPAPEQRQSSRSPR